MRHLMLFEELLSFNKINRFKYEFKDIKDNHYSVVFSGPFKDAGEKSLETGITYELEFTANGLGYRSLTNSGNPFTVSNFIFDTILRDFLNLNRVDTILMIPIDVDEDVNRSKEKKFSRFKLYNRSLERIFSNTKWKIINMEYQEDGESVRQILLIDPTSEFWISNLKSFRKKSSNKILEELKVLSNISKSGSTREIDVIVDEPSNNRSLSSKILLRKRLMEEEISAGETNKLKDFILRSYNSNPRLAILINNLEFLKSKLKENGTLLCEYCNHGPLVIYDSFFTKGTDTQYLKYGKFKPKDGATCDHKVPISKGGDKFDYNNLSVCCSKCNVKKGSMDYDQWINYLGKSRVNEYYIPTYIDDKEEIADLFMSISDTYNLKQLDREDMFGSKKEYFIIKNYDYNYDTNLHTLQFKTFSITDNIKNLKEDIQKFISRLHSFGFDISNYGYTKRKSGKGHLFQFLIKRKGEVNI